MPNSIVVVGGGPGGLMAAGRAAETGASVQLLEKMGRLGRKLLITGNSRCNLSNSKDRDDFLGMYGANGRFLYRAFDIFFREELIDFLATRGVVIKTEPDGRVFPASDDSRDVLRALEGYLEAGGVTVRTRAPVSEVLVDSGRVAGVKVGAETVPAKAVIVACGGSSYPDTGSTGDGFRIAAALGHSIVRLRPALVPLAVAEVARTRAMQGVSLHNIRLTSYYGVADDTASWNEPTVETGRGIVRVKPRFPVIESRIGDLMFTHFGIGGPVTLKMSLAIVDAMENGPVAVSIDLAPDESPEELRRRLQREFDGSGKKGLRNILRGLVSDQVADSLLGVAGVSGDRTGSHVSAEERDRLASVMKSMRFTISSARPFAEAMVTAGGVSLDEIDPRTMGSRIVNGLYFCGEIMDLDAETGGYNLQAAFSTGYLAGQSAATWLASRL